MSADPLRVAYLVSRYPFPSHTFIEREVAGLRALGVEVSTFTVRRTPSDQVLDDAMRAEDRATPALVETGPTALLGLAREALRDPGLTVRMVGVALRTGQRRVPARLRQLLYLAEAVRLHAEMRRRGLRHVHVHFANVAADVARLVVALGRAADGPDAGWRWTMTMHGPTELEDVPGFDLAAKVRDAAAVACISDFARSQLMRLVPHEHWAKLAVVRMSVDPGIIRPPDRPRAHDGPLRVLQVGRLVAEKGSPVLVQALRLARDRGVPVEARVVGTGPLEPELRSAIEAAGLGDVVDLTGLLGQAEIRECYAWADVFCLPSFAEGLPVVLMEALAAGLPVVTTRIAGIPELVDDGVVGRVVTPGRPDEVADALVELSDPALRLAWGARGPAHVTARHDVATTAADQRRFLAGVQAR